MKWYMLLSPAVFAIGFVALATFLSYREAPPALVGLWAFLAALNGVSVGMELTDATRKNGAWKKP
jgi:hypothetical protein